MPQVQYDPIAGILAKARTPNTVRADAWDAFHDARDADELAERLRGLSLDDSVKADLWDLKSAGMDPRRPAATEDFTTARQPEGSATGRFLRNAGDMLNPVTLVKGVAHAVAHPIDTGTALVGAQIDQFREAKQALDEGRFSEAAGHVGAGALPVLGPAAASAGEQIAEGDIAGGLGAGVGLLAPVPLSKIAPKVVRVPGLLKNASPTAAEAVELAQRADIPIDAGTATGNRFVKAAQHVSDRSLGGSLVAGRAAEAQAQGLATLGEQLAAKGYAAPMSAEVAGDSLRTAITGRVRKFAGEADTAYDRLRQFEAHPMHAKDIGNGVVMPLPVDLQAVQQALGPLYQDLSRQAKLTPASMMGDKARALNALDKIMNGERYAPLSTVDAVLGDLKTFARSDEPALRTAGQGAASIAVKNLDAAVQRTAADAGGEVLKALKEGRAATVEKYKAGDVLTALNEEPVRTITKLTAPKDANIQQLREVAQHAPAEIPKIGRAVLDDLLAKATSEGGFSHGAKLAADWDRLGPATKQTLFRDPGYVVDLDRFFRLAKMAAENPNPSGTASTGLAAGQAALAVTNPLAAIGSVVGTAGLSKLLHSKAGVKLLTRGLRIPVANTAARAAWLTDVVNAGVNVTSPSGSPMRTAPAR